MNKEAKFQVAVYGTLRKNGHNHHAYLKDCPQLGTWQLPGYVMMTLAPKIPCILPSSIAEMDVECEIYEVDYATLRRLDGLEGVDHEMYRRVNVDTPLFGRVFVYEAHPKTFKNIFKGGRELMFYTNGDYFDPGRWQVLRADVHKILDHEYLMDAGLRALIPTVKEQLSLPAPEPKEEAFNWVPLYGEVKEAKV